MLSEHLCDYLSHFNKVMLEIPMLEKRVKLEVVKQGVLTNYSFFNSISKVKFTFFQQFKDKA